MEPSWTKAKEFTLNLKFLSSETQVKGVFPPAVTRSTSIKDWENLGYGFYSLCRGYVCAWCALTPWMLTLTVPMAGTVNVAILENGGLYHSSFKVLFMQLQCPFCHFGGI